MKTLITLGIILSLLWIVFVLCVLPHIQFIFNDREIEEMFNGKSLRKKK